MLPTKRAPTTPGEVLREEFLAPLELTQGELAERMGVPVETVNRIVNDKRAVTAPNALRLARVLGTTPEFWLSLQNRVDLWQAQAEHSDDLRKIRKVSG
ncbi:MAG: HigA family addiction module antidote protein [Sandaracinaceae bacterium]|nr:HigA family addiction module antidote protein [Sandaracinaceae bacterium]